MYQLVFGPTFTCSVVIDRFRMTYVASRLLWVHEVERRELLRDVKNLSSRVLLRT